MRGVLGKIFQAFVVLKDPRSHLLHGTLQIRKFIDAGFNRCNGAPARQGELPNNAVRHNLAGGRIAVDLVHGGLRISNTYYPLGFDSSGIFDRFQKGDRSQGTGLGLAIVKQICDRYRFGIQYAYMEGQHVFTLSF